MKTERRPVDTCNGIHYGAVRADRERARMTVNDLHRVVPHLKEKAIAPERVRTGAEARRLNAQCRALGIATRFKVGDEYYSVATLAQTTGSPR